MGVIQTNIDNKEYDCGISTIREITRIHDKLNDLFKELGIDRRSLYGLN
jgi:hypothetical protein